MTNIAVVILNYNGEKLLRQFLPSVIQHSSEAEIVVVDNASTDSSVEVLKHEFPEIKIIALPQNYGFCGGYNRALKQVNARYYVLLNSDVEVTSNWLSPLINLFDNDSTIAAIQPKILSYYQKSKFEYAGAGGGLIDAMGYPFCRGRIFTHVEEDHGQYDDEREIFWATGACLFIRSSVYHQFSGFDEDFFAHMEEIDLCWKINRANMKVYYCGKSNVYHVGAGTLGYENPKKTYLNFRNGIYLIFKHFNTTELLYKFPFRIGLDWLAATMFLMKGKPHNALSILKAHCHFILAGKKIMSKRRAIQNTYPSYSRKNIYSGLILTHYYKNQKHKTPNNPK
jgi:GT2 family glycosyltransferase